MTDNPEHTPGDEVELFDEPSISLATDTPVISIFKKKKKETICILISVLLFSCLILMGISLTLGLYFGLTSQSYPEAPPYFSESDVLQTVEFQIALNPKSSWIYRDTMVDQWIDSMNEYSNDLFSIRLEDAVEDVYEQFHIIATSDKRCSVPEDIEIRFRAYQLSGNNVIELKGEEDSQTKSCTEPFWPAEKYYNISKQKCEEDAHPCFHKYTRGSSVPFENASVTFPYCKNLTDIFPYAFPSINEDNSMHTVAKDTASYWWKLQWKGLIGEHMQYEITFTIRYMTLEKADSGLSSIVEGEWSMRYYSNNEQPPERHIVNTLQDMFYHLVLEYDIDEEHIECGNEYFDGDSNVGINSYYSSSSINTY